MRNAIIIVVLAAACGGESIKDDPIPAVPLAGTLNGVPWQAGSANARMSSTAGEKRIGIYPDAAIGCRSFGDDPYIALSLPWRAGAQTIDLGGEVSAFIMIDITAHIVLDGRVELPEAPVDVGAKPVVRVRASFQDNDDDLFVEGEIPVEICN